MAQAAVVCWNQTFPSYDWFTEIQLLVGVSTQTVNLEPEARLVCLFKDATHNANNVRPVFSTNRRFIMDVNKSDTIRSARLNLQHVCHEALDGISRRILFFCLRTQGFGERGRQAPQAFGLESKVLQTGVDVSVSRATKIVVEGVACSRVVATTLGSHMIFKKAIKKVTLNNFKF